MNPIATRKSRTCSVRQQVESQEIFMSDAAKKLCVAMKNRGFNFDSSVRERCPKSKNVLESIEHRCDARVLHCSYAIRDPAVRKAHKTSNP